MPPETRDRILEAALPLFLAQGMAATRIEQICKSAGVSNGSLFHCFASKEAIGAALYIAAIVSYQSALLGELAKPRPAGETLRAMVLAHWDWIAAEEAGARFLFAQGAPNWHPDTEAAIGAQNARMLDAVADWLAAPAQRAALHPVPPKTFPPLLLGASMMATRSWLRAPASPPPTHLASVFADAALRSLLKDEPA